MGTLLGSYRYSSKLPNESPLKAKNAPWGHTTGKEWRGKQTQMRSLSADCPCTCWQTTPNKELFFCEYKDTAFRHKWKCPQSKILRLEENEGAIKIHLKHFLVESRLQMVKNKPVFWLIDSKVERLSYLVHTLPLYLSVSWATCESATVLLPGTLDYDRSISHCTTLIFFFSSNTYWICIMCQ